MSRSMSFKELGDVLKHIAENNSPLTLKDASLPCIKYVHPSIDMRTNDVFSITFRGFGGVDKQFYIQNEFRDVPESLHDRVMAYLRGETK